MKKVSHAETRRDLSASIVLLALVVCFVLAGLALEGNWPKLLRVSIAATVYLTLLPLLLSSWRRRADSSLLLPFWPFASAACLAELASGWLRPGVPPYTTFWVAPAAALLIGGAHWLALRAWRPLRARIAVRGEHASTSLRSRRAE